MKGTGTECICELHVKKKPEKSSIAALKNRAVSKRLEGINIAWHERVHIEIHGVCSLKRNESGFAIDEIRICHDIEVPPPLPPPLVLSLSIYLSVLCSHFR
jgi:hypothetical protein